MKDLIKNAVRQLVPAILLTSALVGCGGAYSPPTKYSVGGTVNGLLAQSQLTLRNNGGDDLTVSANGAFKFATGVPANGNYAVTVQTQPEGLVCSVVGNGEGSSTGADISNVQIDCIPSGFMVVVNMGGTSDVLKVLMATLVGQPKTIPSNYSTVVGMSNDLVGDSPLRAWNMGQTGGIGKFGAGTYGLIIDTAGQFSTCNVISGSNVSFNPNNLYSHLTSNVFTGNDDPTRKYTVVPVVLVGGNAIVDIQCNHPG